MGALTSKLYAYKARPWEVTSIETVSIIDPFLTKIKLELRDRKILRILPIIGTEEWINDNTRFFISLPKLKSSLINLKRIGCTKIEKILIDLIETQYKPLTINTAIDNLIIELIKKKNLTIITDETNDAKLLRNLRSFDKLKTFIDITVINSINKKPYINTYDSFYLTDTDIIYFSNDFPHLQTLFETKYLNSKRNILDNISMTSFNKRELINILEGSLLINNNIKFVIPYSLKKFIPRPFNFFILDSTNQAYFISSKNFTLKLKKDENFLTVTDNIIWPEFTYLNTLIATVSSRLIPLNPNLIINASNTIETTFVDLFGVTVQAKNIIF